MIGVVVCTHHTLAEALVQTVTQIVGSFEQLEHVGVEYGDPTETTLEKIRKAIAEVDTGDGVVLLCDMFGGTPSNLAISVLDTANVEVVAGVNLPMLIKLASVRNDMALGDAAEAAMESGRKYINMASSLLGARTD